LDLYSKDEFLFNWELLDLNLPPAFLLLGCWPQPHFISSYCYHPHPHHLWLNDDFDEKLCRRRRERVD